jgi:hypothetical protein
MIRRLIQFTKAELYVINVVSPTEIIDKQAEVRKQIGNKALLICHPPIMNLSLQIFLRRSMILQRQKILRCCF